jgi:hypothetical protein
MKAWFCYEMGTSGKWSPVVYFDQPAKKIESNVKRSELKELQIAEPYFDQFGEPLFGIMVSTFPHNI